MIGMRTALTLLATASTLLLIAGCSGNPTVTDDTEPRDQASETVTDEAVNDTPTDGASIAHITSCDQVEAVVSPYIEGLVPADDNGVDEWGVHCLWETAEGETDLANIRVVSVSLTPVEPGSEKPDTSMIENAEGGSVVEAEWITQHDGIAFSLDLGSAVAGATTTTVWVPTVEAIIGGGSWANMPALDGPAAAEVVRQLLKA